MIDLSAYREGDYVAFVDQVSWPTDEQIADMKQGLAPRGLTLRGDDIGLAVVRLPGNITPNP